MSLTLIARRGLVPVRQHLARQRRFSKRPLRSKDERKALALNVYGDIVRHGAWGGAFISSSACFVEGVRSGEYVNTIALFPFAFVAGGVMTGCVLAFNPIVIVGCGLVYVLA